MRSPVSDLPLVSMCVGAGARRDSGPGRLAAVERARPAGRPERRGKSTLIGLAMGCLGDVRPHHLGWARGDGRARRAMVFSAP